jgi:hypothetical protein
MEISGASADIAKKYYGNGAIYVLAATGAASMNGDWNSSTVKQGSERFLSGPNRR